MDALLVNYMKEQLAAVSTVFKRYLYSQLPWDDRMIGITGPRGVGKSTMLLQRIKEQPAEVQARSLYISAEQSYFTIHTLVETADEFVRNGGEWLYIVEVHKYSRWSVELKQIYDTHPRLHIVFTGSSVLDILQGEADLSRKALIFNMQGLSFREYLELFHHIITPVRSLEDVLAGKVEIVGVEHPLPLFADYLRQGYYPFAVQGFFYKRLQQIVRLTMEMDIPQYANMTPATGRKLHQMLTIIAQNVPYKPEITGLANEIKASRNDVPSYLLYMERAGMIGQLRNDVGGMRSLGKVEKVYLDNPNLIYALSGENANIGNVRETFFYNQTREVLPVTSSVVSDFAIGKYTFEVGGAKKGTRQIKDVEDGYVVRDDTEYAADNILPLFAFGLLY